MYKFPLIKGRHYFFDDKISIKNFDIPSIENLHENLRKWLLASNMKYAIKGSDIVFIEESDALLFKIVWY